MYRGGAGDDDALSHFMGQSDYGGATEVGAQSLIGGQNTRTGYSGGADMMALKPPSTSQPGKRRSEYARREDTGGRERSSGLPPRDRPGIQRPEPKKSENYGSFLQGLGGDAGKSRSGVDAASRGRQNDTRSSGFARDRSARRGAENDSVSNVDAVSVGSRRRDGDDYSGSPVKQGGALSQDYDRFGDGTNRTLSQHGAQATP